MDSNVRILLLKIIKFNGDVAPLIKLGYEYSQIIKAINDEISDGNAEQKNGLLGLTEKGNALIEEISRKQGRLHSDKWIEPEIESRVAKIPIDFLFLPSQNELTFRFFD